MVSSPSWIPLSNQKLMVDCTLTHRTKTVCNKPELLQKEIDHLRKLLTHCRDPKWVLDRVEKRHTSEVGNDASEVSNDDSNQGTTGALPTTNEVKTMGHIVIPYTQGLCKSIKKICSWYGIQPTSKVIPL